MNISGSDKFFLYLRIDAWSGVRQLASCLLIGILVIVFGYVGDISFMRKKLKSIRKQVITTEELIHNKKQAAQKTELIFKDAKLLPANGEVKSSNNLPDLGVIDVLTNLERWIAEAQIELSLLEPQVIREDEWLMVYPVKLEVRGGYKRLLKFINDVLRQPHLTVIENVVIQRNGLNSGSNLSMKISLAVYRKKKSAMHPVDQEVVSKVVPIQIPEGDIFKKPDISMGLFLWAGRELVFLGMIQREGKTFGVVSDPMGGVYKVTIGDSIGLGQGKITAIDRRGIVTSNLSDNVIGK